MKRPFAITRRRGKDDVKIILKKYGVSVWSGLIYLKMVGWQAVVYKNSLIELRESGS
jgi:hypothetical protein